MKIIPIEAPPLILLDTHALIWLVDGGPLGKKAQKMIQAAADENRAYISAITPWEVALLVSKKRLTLRSDVMLWVWEALSKPGMNIAPFEPEIAVESTRFPWEMHSDPADRILVATARRLGALLMTADKALLGLATAGHFKAFDATL